ncbi:MAG TPA: LytR C-terminal domain-containing protein [Solirubrobacter sp.]|nr:LytR C-terminal domain-containing protein [Solirubrobacter sp.]
MVLIAFSLQDQVEKYGAYVGIAAFFGLAFLSLLYFAQAREVKRLREWAGRSPERAAELEQAVAEHAQEVRRAPAPRAVPVPQTPAPSVATNGAAELEPAEVAALAFARSAGVHEPHEPKPHPVPVAAVAEETVPAQAVNGGNGATRAVPAPATPAARRADVPPPPPLPPRRAAAAGRRPAAPPPRRESNVLAIVLTAVIGVLVLGGAAFFITRGGGDDTPTASTPPNNVGTPTPEADATEAPTEAPAPTKQTALIGVYNGTGQAGLAANQVTALKEDGYPADNLGTGDTGDGQVRPTSVVMYKRGAKSAAAGVAQSLGIAAVQQFDDTARELATKASKAWDVVVILGNDKTP